MNEIRLIDANALKKALNELFDTDELNPVNTVLFDTIITTIDNAPTVGLEYHSFIEGYKEGCEEGKKCYERPQGE